MLKTERNFDRIAKECFNGLSVEWHAIGQLSYNRNVPTAFDGGTQV